jgi:uncharacterized protein with PQ loop repeat
VVVGLSFAFAAASANNVAWVIDAMGIIPTVIAVFGYFPQYVELYKTRNPHGVSLVFLTIDLIGAAFAIAALFLADEFIIVASLLYFSIALCSSILFTATVSLRIVQWRQAKRTKDLESVGDRTIVPPTETEVQTMSVQDVKLEAV